MPCGELWGWTRETARIPVAALLLLVPFLVGADPPRRLEAEPEYWRVHGDDYVALIEDRQALGALRAEHAVLREELERLRDERLQDVERCRGAGAGRPWWVDTLTHGIMAGLALLGQWLL